MNVDNFEAAGPLEGAHPAVVAAVAFGSGGLGPGAQGIVPGAITVTTATATGEDTALEFLGRDGSILDNTIGDANARTFLDSEGETLYMVDRIRIGVGPGSVADIGTLTATSFQFQAKGRQPVRVLPLNYGRGVYSMVRPVVDASAAAYDVGYVGDPSGCGGWLKLPYSLALLGSRDSLTVTLPQTSAAVNVAIGIHGVAIDRALLTPSVVDRIKRATATAIALDNIAENVPDGARGQWLAAVLGRSIRGR